MLRKKYIPHSVAWELTLACNMNCTHCGSSAGATRPNELTTKEALDLCDQLHDLKVKNVNLTGGEPILRKDWIQIATKIRSLGMNISILSNGLAIDETRVALFKKLHIYAVAISLDGATPETHDGIRGVKGSFKKCLETLELLYKNDLPVTVITTVHKGNFEELPKIKDLILHKTRAWQIQIAVPIGRFPKEMMVSEKDFYALALFIASTRKQYSPKKLAIMGAHSIGYHSQIIRNTSVSPVWKGCQAGITVLGIQSDGSVKGCLSLPDTFIEGNIRTKKLSEIWNDPTSFSYSRHPCSSDLKNHCARCKYGNTCHGGCTTVSSSSTGSPHTDPYCLYSIEKRLGITR